MTTIIGFGYRSRSGKDSAAAHIIKQVGVGYDVQRYAFADAVKREVTDEAYQMGGMNNLISLGREFGRFPEWVQYDSNAPMDDPLCPLGKQRTLLQWWGTNYRRAQDEDYWVKQVVKKIAEDKPEFALLTDFRFENEASILDFKVKVDRPGIPVLDHPSEHALDKYEGWDIVISNDSDLDTFQRRVLSTFEFIRGYTQGQHSYNEKFKDLTLFGC